MIARFLLREHYLPRTRVEEDRAAAGGARVAIATHLRSLQEGLVGSRSIALLPFCVSVLAYYPDERVTYDLDLVRSLILTDPRAAGSLLSAACAGPPGSAGTSTAWSAGGKCRSSPRAALR